MKKKAIVSLLLALALLPGLLTGCGSRSAASRYADNAAMEEVAEAADMTAAGALEAGLDTGAELTQPDSRKWIITMDMSAETEDLDALLAALTEEIAALKGYVEDQNIHNGSAYATRRYRNANLTVRIPAADVDGFTQAVAGIANVVSSSKSLEDVTLQYSDTETRVKALETEQNRLLELMESAESMADLLEIESRLTEVRYELERYTSRLKRYDNQIDYATVYLSIEEVQEYTPVEEPTLWERISKGFKDNLEGVGDDLLDVLVWLIVSIPYLVVLAVVVVIVVLIVKRIRRRRAAKKAAKQQKPEES